MIDSRFDTYLMPRYRRPARDVMLVRVGVALYYPKDALDQPAVKANLRWLLRVKILSLTDQIVNGLSWATLQGESAHVAYYEGLFNQIHTGNTLWWLSPP